MSASATRLSYRDAGVDLDAAEALTARIATRLEGALFGGFVPVPGLKQYDSPVLVSSIDGIGTKVRLAALLGRVDTLGRDIVHHCVNDIAVHGAQPLFFVDYLAFHSLDPELVTTLVDSIAAACHELGIALAGGETAEMPLVYPAGQFDVAGAIVGAVEQDAIVDGSAIRPGDVIIGFASDGLHTNGYSLVQRVFTEQDYDDFEPAIGCTLGDALLLPHRCYLSQIRDLLATETVHGLAHITGGGIAGNLRRILPAGLEAEIHLPPPPPLFGVIAQRGVDAEEMLRVFNMGVGLIAVCDPSIWDVVPCVPEPATSSTFNVQRSTTYAASVAIGGPQRIQAGGMDEPFGRRAALGVHTWNLKLETWNSTGPVHAGMSECIELGVIRNGERRVVIHGDS